MARIASLSGRSVDAATTDFRTMALLHTFVRLSLILRCAKRRGWGSHARLLRHDHIGTTPEHARRLCRRGARWAAKTEGVQEYLPFLERVEHERLDL